MKYSITPLGDSAVTVNFGNSISTAVHAKVLWLTNQIRERNWVGIRDVVPAYSSVTLHYNVVELLSTFNASAIASISRLVTDLLSTTPTPVAAESRLVHIPVCYAPRFGHDQKFVSSHVGLSVQQIISLHVSKIYRVFMLGFLPGFAYMGCVDKQIFVPRKSTPALQTPAGSVGIAGEQTGIYPLTSPGGWQIIGRTPLHLFNSALCAPVLLEAGDEVQFYSISEYEFENFKGGNI